MQKGMRINEHQLNLLANKAKVENSLSGPLFRRYIDSAKWQLKWFALQHNILYCYDAEGSQKLNSYTILEGCYVEEIALPTVKEQMQHGLAVYLMNDHNKLFELRSDSEADLRNWMDCLNNAKYSKLQEDKEQLEQKHDHVLHILEAERHAKWHSMRQIEELVKENRQLNAELKKYKVETVNKQKEKEYTEICKIKKQPDTSPDSDPPVTTEVVAKVQSFFRGWLCRRRWKQIVEMYIKSPHAESMKTRNNVVFGMVEDEEDYVRDLSTLVTCFLRPLRMAASSKKPVISHDDVNSIFLNSETVLFLHQIFLKGLTARMENWPTLVIGDLFDMLLPMLGIYQEYVRNHHYSLQVLTEYKQKPEFNSLLKRFEEKPACENRVLETFLTYPMHQIPKYILALHELLAHTPYEHVERTQLEYARSKLDELSLIMHDEVSETENIRKNLAIERMITEGCDILLDTSQVFVRQGTLLQLTSDKSKYGGLKLSNLSSTFKDKEIPRKVFLFTHHLLITNRASNGRLHLAKNYGKIPLAQCTLIEDTCFDANTCEEEGNSIASQNGWCNRFDFRIIVHSKDKDVPAVSLTFVASSLQEKSSWCSDISQCMENLHYTENTTNDFSSGSLPQSVRVDHKVFKDDKSVKYCRTVKNSCKIPQIRHATVEKLLERLTDLRFLSVDFLNSFLLTYKVFTDNETVINSLRMTVRKACLAREHEENSLTQDDDVDKESTTLYSMNRNFKEKLKRGLLDSIHESASLSSASTESPPNNNAENRKLQIRSSVAPLSDLESGEQALITAQTNTETIPEDTVFIADNKLDENSNKISKCSSTTKNSDVKSPTSISPTTKLPMSPRISSPRPLIPSAHKNVESHAQMGGIITSSRISRRRCSSSAATSAFAAATAGASAAAMYIKHPSVGSAPSAKCSVSSTSTAIMRALNVFKHWVSKYPQSFQQDANLAASAKKFLEDLIISSQLVPVEQKLAANIFKALTKELDEYVDAENLKIFLNHSTQPLMSHGTFESIAALDIAEQITYLDHQIIMGISSEELLGQAWMKVDKASKAPHVIQASQRFNEVSQLVVTEIVLRSNIQDRVTCIEKWAAIADILHCMQNYNGVLQIYAAFVNSSVYRLSKTWEKISKHTKQIIAKLQQIVSSDGRFKNMREALHKCDGPAIPYLGMYLSDLSFIEEGAPDFVEDGLVNYSKMRMISNVIGEIQQYQQQSYTIQYNANVCAYLLDRSCLLSDEQTYQQSLTVEPRLSTSSYKPHDFPDKLKHINS